MCMPGAIVLAGWPALPWGQLGLGPVPPSLAALGSAMELDVQQLEDVIDVVYRLDDLTSPPEYLRTGKLRPAIHVAFASQLMYFEERTRVNEMPKVQANILRSMRESQLPGAKNITEAVIYEWGRAIQAQFKIDNLHLTARTMHADHVQYQVTKK
ncbi:hypothetical protein CYMTET_19297 [Cymbomonas tetramitiformis]|uniref:Uncharacterized protein n=1 Tax=Cymbomonas tetramitiformis TaxID=36881 RepID=A0AAE0G6B4_9CHLO|nr:hypothetical protein CYMTET_19297 [Cymbomonas tetramitiformis]